MNQNTPDQTTAAAERRGAALRPPDSSPFQLYQRLGYHWLDDAARELSRRQVLALVHGLMFRAKHVHGVEGEAAA
jgi:hypothetical protein